MTNKARRIIKKKYQGPFENQRKIFVIFFQQTTLEFHTNYSYFFNCKILGWLAEEEF